MSDLFTPQYSLYEQILLTQCKWISQQKNIWATGEGLLPGVAGKTWQIAKAISSTTVQYPFTNHHNDSAAKAKSR